MDTPLVSICIPYYKGMKDAEKFLKRCIDSVEKQTYRNCEIIITEEGRAAHNTNEAMKQANGDLIKVLYMDDYLTHENVIKDIVENFKGEWMITGCNNNLNPIYMGDIHHGNNKLGGPSALTIRNKDIMLFDESLRWMFDCDYYKRMHAIYGDPVILNGDYITVGEGDHQATNMLDDKTKLQEVITMRKRYD